MSQPPKEDEQELTNRAHFATDRQALAGKIESHLPSGAGAEGLCHTMPELGSIPFVPGRDKGRRVVRLVSCDSDPDLSIELQVGVNKIGRQRDGNHIVLVSGEVSRFHAEVHVSEDAIVVHDLGSSNGTLVNGERVTDRSIDAGDVLGFSSQFLFKVQIDMAMQAPGVLTLEPGGREPLPRAAQAVGSPGDVPASLEDRRRKLGQPLSPPPSPPAPGASPVMPIRHATAPRGIAPFPLAATPREAAAPVPAPILPGPPSRPSPVMPQSPQPPSLLPGTRPQPPARGASPLAPMPPLPESAPEPSYTPPAASPPPTGGMIAPEDSLVDPIQPINGPVDAGELAILERERRQLAVLYQVSKRCMAAENLSELDRLLINVLERIVAFERGFITYQLPNGDWKLVMSPKGDRWDRTVVRGLLQSALRGKAAVVVRNSAADDQLGNPGPGRTDARLLLPLRTRSAPVGAIFLISSRSDGFDDQTVDFLSLFSDIAALAVVSCARMEGRTS